MNPMSKNRRSAGRNGTTTLADVARAAGVSISTAGRVLRDEGWPVDPALKERVRRAAKELSYVRNAMARTLRAGSPAMVGLIVGNMLDPYYGEIAESVTRYAESTGQILVAVCNMQRDPKLEMVYCQRLWEHRVGGLILAGGGFDQFTYHADLRQLLDGMARSGVVVTTLSPRDLDFPNFNVDNVEVGRLAAGELLRHGHRHIGIVVGPLHNRVLRQRVEGAAACCRDAGVAYYLAEASEFGPQGIDRSVAQMYENAPDITGIIAASGVTSISMVHAVMATGRTVPGDVSVIGVGGSAIDWFSTPPLHRIDQALATCGRAALDHIAACVAGTPPSKDFLLRPSIVPGRSIAPWRA